MSDIILCDLSTGNSTVLVDTLQGAAGSSPPNIITNISTTTTATVLAGSVTYVNLSSAGVTVVLNPSGIMAGVYGFAVKLIGSSIGAGSTCTINPMVAGSHIESRVTPGSLTTSLVLGAPGDGVTLGSPDGINLYYS